MDIKRLQNYIVDRVLEILHKETLDSYRIRNHNVFTSLVETRETILRWNQMKVKNFETVKLLGSECLSMLKKDDILLYDSYERDSFQVEFSEYLRRNDKAPDQIANNRILYCLNKCIEENKDKYLDRLSNAIVAKIDNGPDVSDEDLIQYLESLDAYLSAFCVQLVNAGYSKQHLYLTLKKESGSFTAFKDELVSLVHLKTKEYVVIWRIRSPKSEVEGLKYLGFKLTADYPDTLTEDQREKSKKYNSPAPSTLFYTDNVKALDIYSAMKTSRENLMKRFDNIHLGKFDCSLNIPANALVCQKMYKGWYVTNTQTSYYMDGHFSNDFAMSTKCSESLGRIFANNSIDESVKDRLKSAIRHLNCGDSDTELEQRFINYWIALEFIFASPHTDENTYTRMKIHLINVLSCSYIKRNVDYLSDKLVGEGLMENGYDLFDSQDSLDAVAERTDLPLVWYFKLKQMKSRLLSHTDKRRDYYQNHVTNLQCHLARIYNLRNALVHEGALKQDVENVTSNLRYYLIFMLDQIISYFCNIKDCKYREPVNLEDFFNEYISYKKVIERDYNLSIILSIPVTRNLW